MQVVIGGFVILSMVAAYKVRTIGLPAIERTIARWLLADARSWEAKGATKKLAQKEFSKLA
jgi:hypothetical protein